MSIDEKVGAVILSRESVVANPLLSLFQKVLMVTDGSVTELLGIYTGQKVRADKLEQFVMQSVAPELLECDEGTELLHRKIMLMERENKLVYAESAFIFDRLTPHARTQLLDSDTPIGLLWKEEKSEMYREIVDLRIEVNSQVANHFGLSDGAKLLSRTYLLRQNDRPLGMITEKFPATSFCG